MSTEELTLHSTLKRRVVVDCIVETMEPLHVGMGKETLSVSEVDMPVMTDSSENPIIPGSSIRGALRAHVTRLLSSLDETTLNGEFNVRKVKAKDKEVDDFQKAESQGEKMEKFRESLGVVDKLFGVSGYASPLRITDATPYEKIDLADRTHVKIDNDLDRAVEGGLFDAQFVPEKKHFGFKIVFDELNDHVTLDVSNVFYKLILKQLGEGLEIFLGGMKSRGYGLTTIKAKQVLAYTPKQLALGEKPNPITDINQFIDEALKEKG
ncbi:MAG: CRISPR-associated RAMP protein [Candidatus Freyarchaeota archaeon]|nr:CRISPR-associated RAMP protein [Candidatus Jordarchaeia archaeon]MBS7269238.1 CRISPR-associated RAMP protein [Candidatus Jordarchaeia archaeon]MBS7280108.1 CRISPR-associated RAMP protein [Candidatus Jordarchaeia archaeon]